MSTINLLLHNKDGAFILEDLIDLDNVGMVKFLEYSQFNLTVDTRMETFLVDDFDSSFFLKLFVETCEHRTKTTTTEFVFEGICVEDIRSCDLRDELGLFNFIFVEVESGWNRTGGLNIGLALDHDASTLAWDDRTRTTHWQIDVGCVEGRSGIIQGLWCRWLDRLLSVST